MLFRACFHIEGDWRPFEDGILWENEGAASPVESKYRIILFLLLCNITYKKCVKNITRKISIYIKQKQYFSVKPLNWFPGPAGTDEIYVLSFIN